VTVRVPPLRERLRDVPPLAKHFVASYNAAFGKRVRGLSAGAITKLSSYSWPGNIRELKNVIESAMVMSEGDLLTEADLPASWAPNRPRRDFALPADGIDLAQLERDLLDQALERSGGNRTRAARLLGLTRHQIRRRLQARPETPSRRAASGSPKRS
jgi:DNA-binding NtrC family response regulator